MRKLYGTCTVERFKELRKTSPCCHKIGGKQVIIDTVQHTVAFNNHGKCSIESFGSIEIAKRAYRDIKGAL